MAVETIRMSSKGQLVIPQDIREEVHAEEGTVFMVVGSKDTIVLKKIITPSKEELIRNLGEFAKKMTPKMEKLGIKECDVPKIIKQFRREKREA